MRALFFFLGLVSLAISSSASEKQELICVAHKITNGRYEEDKATHEMKAFYTKKTPINNDRAYLEDTLGDYKFIAIVQPNYGVSKLVSIGIYDLKNSLVSSLEETDGEKILGARIGIYYTLDQKNGVDFSCGIWEAGSIE